MKSFFGFITLAVAAVLLEGCLGSGGSSAPAPLNVAVVAKDNRVVVTWDMLPGVEYWIWKSDNSGVTPTNCTSSCGTAMNVTSPASISATSYPMLGALTNGTTYYFTINGRTNGGPGGPGSPAVSATPRLAGSTWATGTSPTANDLHGVAYGTLFVTAGTGGALYSSTNGSTWIAATTNPAPSTNFSAVNYDAALAKYLVAGAGGVILESSDAATWTLLTSVTTKTSNNLFAIASVSGHIVATGAGGTIITSPDGTNWTLQTSGTVQALNGVVYGWCTSLGVYRFVAVGASGTVLYSLDGVTWTAAASVSTSSEIKSVTHGLVAGVGTFVAVTADGKAITSTDGSTWTTPVAVSSALNAVTASLNSTTPSLSTVTNAFVAVGNAGIFRSTDGGVTWQSVSGSGPLYAVTHGGLLDYSAAGAGGLNLYAD
jgi:hypothetical protein